MRSHRIFLGGTDGTLKTFRTLPCLLPQGFRGFWRYGGTVVYSAASRAVYAVYTLYILYILFLVLEIVPPYRHSNEFKEFFVAERSAMFRPYRHNY